MIPLVDVLCLGDGENWIKQALLLLENKTIDALCDLPGSIVSAKWQVGTPLPERNYCKPLPDNPPYLNRPGTLSAAWYIEIARGCPYHCHYCELGNSMPYRYRPKDEIKGMLDNLDTSMARKIVFFAPDEASHPAYAELIDYSKSLGLRQGFGSYRLDKILQMGGLPFAANQLVRKKYFDEFVEKKDLYLFVGTTLQHHRGKSRNPFIIIGVFYPPKNFQTFLF